MFTIERNLGAICFSYTAFGMDKYVIEDVYFVQIRIFIPTDSDIDIHMSSIGTWNQYTKPE